MRLVSTFLLLVLSVFLYGIFGVLCAMTYKALEPMPAKVDMASSPMLKDFIDSKSATATEMSVKDLQEGVVHIMFSNSLKKNKAGQACVMPSFPIINSKGDNLLVSVPVYLNTFVGNMGSRVVFEFSAKDKFELENLHVGNAKIPHFAHGIVSKMVSSIYEDVSDGYIDVLARMKVQKNGEVIRFSK